MVKADTKKPKSIKLNFIMNTILTMSSFIFPLITFPYVSRVLGPAGTGKVQFALSFISYFTLVAHLGIPTYGIRACASVRDDRKKLSKTVHELLIINLIMSLLSYIAFFIIIFTVPKLQDDRLLYIIVSFNILLTSIGMEWLYKALEQYTYITIRSIIFKFIALLAMFALIREKNDYVIYGGISIFAGVASNIFNFIHVHRFIDMKPMKDYNVKRHLNAVGIFFAMSCATTIYTHLDTVMLKFITTDTDVGYYGAATKIKTILVSVVTSLGTVLLPRVSYYVKNGQTEEFKRISKKALNFVILLASPLTVYFMMYASQGIRFLSGKGYSGAIVPMQIIMPTLLLIGLSNILGIQILVPLGKEKIVLYSEIAGAVVNLILNAALIPLLKSSGAAIGTLVAEFVVLLVQYIYIRKDVIDAIRKISFGKIIAALILAAAASFWVPLVLGSLGLSTMIRTFVILAVSGSLFFGVYGVFLLISKEELTNELFWQMLRKKKGSKK
ncbi:MAG TPA: flippase [Ruminococcus sp.]|nr:flippase [Ruminococcus sp.]